ncbi:MAG TPA: type VI secretion system baseplate subunit TssG [Roseiarcus sp.]|nr:type VI secretion system baseplate subunit TssG [Roseiarcus sp.]
MTWESELLSEPWRFDLLDALRRFERDNPGRPRIGDARTLADEYVAITQNPYMEFPASTLEGAEREPSGRMRLVARFLGMFGPQGALPLTTTEETYHWLLERDDAFPRFADIFQRRFLALFFRAWADPRPIAQHDRPAADRFIAYIGSMIGVGTPPYRGVDSLPDFAKMEFSGLIAPKAKSGARLRRMIAGMFGVKVEIDEFVGAWLAMEKGERSMLGAARSAIGRDCIVGSMVFSVSEKFRIRIFVKNFAQYLRFLPGAELSRQVADAVFLHLGDEFDWDMELAIPAGETTPVRLGQGATLGWTSWMAPNWSRTDQAIRTDARFHVVSRLTHERAKSGGEGNGRRH